MSSEHPLRPTRGPRELTPEEDQSASYEHGIRVAFSDWATNLGTSLTFFAIGVLYLVRQVEADLMAGTWDLSSGRLLVLAPVALFFLIGVLFYFLKPRGRLTVKSGKVTFSQSEVGPEVPVESISVLPYSSAREPFQAEVVLRLPNETRKMRLPAPQASARLDVLAFLLAIQSAGASIKMQGFAGRPVSKGEPERVFCRTQIDAMAASLSAFMVHAAWFSIPFPPIASISFWLGLAALANLVRCFVLLFTPVHKRIPLVGKEIQWTSDSVTIKGGREGTRVLPREELKALMFERRKAWLGLERARLSLVTNYGRVVPLTHWTPRLGSSEMALLELASGAGLEVRIEGEPTACLPSLGGESCSEQILVPFAQEDGVRINGIDR